VLIYLGISFGIAMIFIASGVTGEGAMSISSKSLKNVTVGIVTEQDSDLGANLKSYIKKSFNTGGVSEISASGNDIKEALYSGATSYIVVINGDEISDYQAPNNTSAYIAQNYINNYINTYRAMAQLYPDSSAGEWAKLTERNLNDTVRIEDLSVAKTDTSSLNNFFNIFVYGVLGALISGIGVAMIALNERKFYLRTVVSPVSIRRRNAALFSAQASFGAFIWLVSVAASIYFAGDARFSPVHIMFIVNSIPFVLSVTAIGFFIGQTVRNETVFNGVTTVLMLCISFLSGAFIPQEFLADSVLKISALTPAYWFIVNNNKIGAMEDYDWGALAGPIIVMLVFTAALILAGTVVTFLKTRTKIPLLKPREAA
jgi:ABC-2 type transport system permease protein